MDSLDPSLLREFKEYLPNITGLLGKSSQVELESVFPADSIPAWVSIYTGKHPSNHGIVKSFDVFDSDLEEVLKVDNSALKGKTFWDYAGQNGKSVCVVSPLLVYPPWEVNGFMSGRSLSEKSVKGKKSWLVARDVKTYPKNSFANLIPITEVNGKHHGEKNLRRFCEACRKATKEQFAMAEKLYQQKDWDLFFAFFDYLDIIQHRFWRHYDKADPTHPKNSKLKNTVRDFYILLDGLIGDFLSKTREGAAFILLSDHGHKQRPYKVLNINKLLREYGLLKVKTGKTSLLPYFTEYIKKILLNVSKTFGFESLLVKIATSNKTLSKLSKNIYTLNNAISKDESIAKLSDFAGIKSYSHGGIEVNKNALSNAEYEAARQKIILKLKSVKEPKTNKPLFKWICPREEFCRGVNAESAFPDILFELKEDWGTGWNVYRSTFSKASDHKLASGGHSKNACFIAHNLQRDVSVRKAKLIDIAPTILGILGIGKTYDFDGKSILDDE